MQVNVMLFVWLGLLALFLIAEFATVQLTTVWFAVGALVSLIMLILTRPLVKKWMRRRTQPTNADMVIGEQAVVTEAIDNAQAKGLVKVKGAVWSARSADDSRIPVGAAVTVKAIEGVKLIVEA